jgi:hypothetical protein
MQDLYVIRIKSHLAPRRFRAFEGLVVTQQPSGETVLVAPVTDQSALYGLLSWLQDLGATLLLVKRIHESDEAFTQPLNGEPVRFDLDDRETLER